MTDTIEQGHSEGRSELSSPVVLVLVGLIASGKSTFAKALEAHVPRFRRCNQDELGSRLAVENLARHALRQGLSVCIDRTNIDETQRAHWINIAREIPGTQVWCLVFDTPRHICATRLQTRVDHPTIRSPEVGYRVLHRFANDYSAPTFSEGFDHIFCLRPSDHPTPSYSAEPINSILAQVGEGTGPAEGDHSGRALSHQQEFFANYLRRGAHGKRRHGDGDRPYPSSPRRAFANRGHKTPFGGYRGQHWRPRGAIVDERGSGGSSASSAVQETVSGDGSAQQPFVVP